MSEEAITRILWSVRSSTHVRVVQTWEKPNPEDRTVGYVGGLPEMPADARWEYGEFFVASLDLAALPEQPLDDEVPREGRLLLFADTEYWFSDAPARVIHVLPGTETSVRPAPSIEGYVQEVLDRRDLVLTGAGWDVLNWQEPHGRQFGPDARESTPESPEEAVLREWHAHLVAAVEEYGAKVGDTPVIEPTATKVGGVVLNPRGWTLEGDLSYWAMGQEALRTLKDHPEGFDELHERALCDVSSDKDDWVNLVEFGQYGLFQEGDGELSWTIRREDLLARRFDAVETSFNTT